MTDPFERAALAELEQRADGKRKGLVMHAVVWATINGFLVLVWLLAGGGYPWFLFPAGGMAIPLVLHAAATRVAGPDEAQVALQRARRAITAGDDDW